MAWTAPTTRVTGDLITASIWNTDLTDNLAYLKTQTDLIDDYTQSDVTASRALNTVYQNTSGKLMFAAVEVVLFVSNAGTSVVGSSYATAQNGAANPPTQYIHQAGITLQFDGLSSIGSLIDVRELTMFIPVAYYYRIVPGNAGHGVAPSLGKWIEWSFH